MEILPPESADFIMYYNKEDRSYVITDYPDDAMSGEDDIPCWSLAALLDLLKQVKEIKYQRVTILVGRFAGNHWYVEILRVQDERAVVLEHSKELIDACVEIIMTLHGQKGGEE